MRRPVVILTAIAVLLAGVLGTAGCSRKVTVTTGEIVLCTAGEILEDNTEQVEVPENQAADYAVTTKVITCERHSDLGKLYEQAQQEIRDGDLKTAAKLLTAILEGDPVYRKAREQADAIAAGRKPEADDTSASDSGSAANEQTATAKPDEGGPVGPVANLANWVPDTLDGYIAQGITADLASLSRQYLPESKQTDQLVVAVDQSVSRKTAAAEAANLDAQYPDGNATKSIAGHKVRVGALDGFAAASFSDGPVVIVVELHAKRGSGTDYIDEVLDVVRQLLG